MAKVYVHYGHNYGHEAACGKLDGARILPHGEVPPCKPLDPVAEWCPKCLEVCRLQNPPPLRPWDPEHHRHDDFLDCKG